MTERVYGQGITHLHLKRHNGGILRDDNAPKFLVPSSASALALAELTYHQRLREIEEINDAALKGLEKTSGIDDRTRL